EVAYEGLLLKQRRQLHERIGDLLETGHLSGTPESSALVAHHHVRSDNREKAIAALLRAAREPEPVPAYRPSARFYREAWEQAESGLGKNTDVGLVHQALSAAVNLCRMAVIYDATDAVEAEHIAHRARALAAANGDAANLGNLLTFEGM